jgi:hypothetical protein
VAPSALGLFRNCSGQIAGVDCPCFFNCHYKISTVRTYSTDRVTEDRQASLRLILVPSWRCVARHVPSQGTPGSTREPEAAGQAPGAPNRPETGQNERERNRSTQKAGAAHTPSTGPPKTPCSWSTSGTPPTPGNLLRQISSYAIGARHHVIRLPSVDCLMCSFARPVLHTSDTSSRHAFTPMRKPPEAY